MKRIKEASQHFKILTAVAHNQLKYQSSFNPHLYDDSAMVNSIVPHHGCEPFKLLQPVLASMLTIYSMNLVLYGRRMTSK